MPLSHEKQSWEQSYYLWRLLWLAHQSWPQNVPQEKYYFLGYTCTMRYSETCVSATFRVIKLPLRDEWAVHCLIVLLLLLLGVLRCGDRIRVIRGCAAGGLPTRASRVNRCPVLHTTGRQYEVRRIQPPSVSLQRVEVTEKRGRHKKS